MLGTEKREFVRIIIGIGVTGKTGIKSPTRSISVEDTNIEEVYEIIEKVIKDKIEEKKVKQ